MSDKNVVIENPAAEGDEDPDIDEGIGGLINEMNQKGFKTEYSCSGLPSDHYESDVTDDQLEEVQKTARCVYISIDLNSFYMNLEAMNDLFYVDGAPTWNDLISGKVPLKYYLWMNLAKRNGNIPERIGNYLCNIRESNELNVDAIEPNQERLSLIDLIESGTRFRVLFYFPFDELTGDLRSIIEDYCCEYIDSDSMEGSSENKSEGGDEEESYTMKEGDVSNEADTESDEIDLEDVDEADLKNIVSNMLPDQRLSSLHLNRYGPTAQIRPSQELKEMIDDADSVEEVEQIVSQELESLEYIVEGYIKTN